MGRVNWTDSLSGFMRRVHWADSLGGGLLTDEKA